MRETPARLSEILREDFAARKKVNPQFSLRAYAKALELSPSHLSQILSAKRGVKPKSALKICTRLGLTPSEALALMQEGQGASEPHAPVRMLSKDEFSLIAQWYYYGILGLANLRFNSSDPRWIARRLGLDVATAKAALDELVRHGHVEVRGLRFRQVTAPLRTQDDVPAASVRRYHRQNLNLAYDRIEQIDPALREFATMTIPMSPSKVAAAKKMLRKFREEFSAEMARGNKTEVYNLCLQFFPVTLAENPKEKK